MKNPRCFIAEGNHVGHYSAEVGSRSIVSIRVHRSLGLSMTHDSENRTTEHRLYKAAKLVKFSNLTW